MRLIFVDDEPLILQGLQRALRPMAKQWTMDFAAGGKEALAKMSEAPYDVIVSDVRMPEMSGAQLLEEVKRRHPNTVRMVLSGQATRQELLGFIGTCHQYLSKPCEIDELKSKVCSAIRLRDLLTNDTLRSIASQLTTLPSLPVHYREVMSELETAEPSVRKIGNIIASDAGMTAKILQLANSALLGVRHQISDPFQAVSLIGMDMLRALLISVQIFSKFEKGHIDELEMSQLWKHTLAVAKLSRAIAGAERQPRAMLDDCFTAGLLHDLGKLVFSCKAPVSYREILQKARSGESLCSLERASLGCSHSELGAYLVAIWGLPYSIAETLAWHHDPAASGSTTFAPLSAVHIANVLVAGGPLAHFPESQTVDEAYVSSIGLGGRKETYMPLYEEVMDAMTAEA